MSYWTLSVLSCVCVCVWESCKPLSGNRSHFQLEWSSIAPFCMMENVIKLSKNLSNQIRNLNLINLKFRIALCQWTTLLNDSAMLSSMQASYHFRCVRDDSLWHRMFTDTDTITVRSNNSGMGMTLTAIVCLSGWAVSLDWLTTVTVSNGLSMSYCMCVCVCVQLCVLANALFR